MVQALLNTITIFGVASLVLLPAYYITWKVESEQQGRTKHDYSTNRYYR